MSETVVVLDAINEDLVEQLRARLPPGLELTYAAARGEEAMKAVIAQADYAISGQVAVTGEVLRAAQRLKLLHKWGVGVDNLDLAAARALGIPVARTTGSNAVAVAEFALGLMLAAMRSIAYGHARLASGVWVGVNLPVPTYMISGKTVGLIGFGMIGQSVARLLKSFGCPILYNKRTPLPAEEEAALGARYASVEEILRVSDIVSLHCPLTPQTAGLIDAAALRLMKPTATLVNVARGGIVVESDLAEALRERVIHAAAMDVFEIEPLPPSSALIGLDNLVVTPHLGAIAADIFGPTVDRMFANMMRVSRGEALPALDVVA